LTRRRSVHLRPAGARHVAACDGGAAYSVIRSPIADSARRPLLASMYRLRGARRIIALGAPWPVASRRAAYHDFALVALCYAANIFDAFSASRSSVRPPCFRLVAHAVRRKRRATGAAERAPCPGRAPQTPARGAGQPIRRPGAGRALNATHLRWCRRRTEHIAASAGTKHDHARRRRTTRTLPPARPLSPLPVGLRPKSRRAMSTNDNSGRPQRERDDRGHQHYWFRSTHWH